MSFPRDPHSPLIIIAGQRRESPNSPILHKPPSPLFICITSQSYSYKYPLSFSLSSFYFFFFFFASCSLQQRSHQESLLLLLPWTNHTPPPSTSLHHFVRTGSSFWIGAVFLLRRQNLGSVPSFWIGTELPFVGRSKDLDRRVFSLTSCLLKRVLFLAKDLTNLYFINIRS